MSFNVWNAENTTNGRGNLVSAVQAGMADIVGFQEMDGSAGNAVAASLGMNYDSGSSIASVFPIIDTSFSSGVKLELAPGQEAYVFNVHLRHYFYGPYQLAGIPYLGGPLYDPNDPADIAAVVQDQVDSRGAEIAAVLNEMQIALASGLPVFLTGDFNEASHLDWTQAAAAAGVHSAEVSWPTSIDVQNAGLTDSFRQVHIDETAIPGNTWSPVLGPNHINEGVNEPQDRIDFVYYTGRNISVTSTNTVGPSDAYSDIGVNSFPSDHRAVVSKFSISTCSVFGDLDGDCQIGSNDWTLFRAGQHTDLSGLTQQQAYSQGDLNGDFINDHADFVLFKKTFESINGEGSFAAMVVSVPEPASWWLVVVGGLSFLWHQRPSVVFLD